jgi:virginiamycin B lyase
MRGWRCTRLRGDISRRLGPLLLGSLVGFASAFGFASGAAASLTDFALPTGVYLGGGIAAGPDGALWFTAKKGNVSQIGRLTTSGSYSEFGGLTDPRPGYPGPRDITAGPDGRLWFTEFDANKIGAITTDGVVTEYATGLTSGAGPNQITAGPDGRLWFTEWSAGKIGAITTAGKITEYPLPNSDSEPYGITAGPYGDIWFTEHRGQAIGHITTDGAITERRLDNEYPHYAPLGAITRVGSTLWVTNTYSNKIGKYDIDDHLPFVEWFGPALNSYGLGGITAGPDGALWFTDSRFIGRITTGGLITNAIRLPSPNSAAEDIVSGPDGALWFIASDNPSRIGRITTDVPPPPTVELRLSVSPPSDPGRFDLSIDGEIKKANAGNGDTTGKHPVSVMYHRVRETGVGMSLSQYTTAMTCKDEGGSGVTVPDTTFYDGQGWVPVASGSDIVCTIVNQRRYPPSNLSVSQSSGIVQASWELPPSTLTGFLEFSPSPYLDQDGSFSHGLTISYQFDSTDTTFDSTPEEFPPGTYYVHVSAYDPDDCDYTSCHDQFSSPPVTLIVPGPLQTPVSAPAAISTAAATPKPVVADKVTAFSSLLVPSRQKLGKLYVQAAMHEPGTISARGNIRVGKQSRSYRFATVSAPAVPGTSVRLRLKLPSKALTAVRRALKRHKKASAKVMITATDSAGNKKHELRTVGLRL